MLPSVEYLGHKISDKGIQPTEVKICAIVKAPAPNNVSQPGPAESVRLLRFWPVQFFLKVKAKFHFWKRQVINKVLVWFWDLLGLLY